MSSATVTDTKTQILDVAERLIAERGFSATTLRNVVSEAGVNLAAVHYHFGSKEELFRAVVQRIARPVMAHQLALLEQFKQENQPLAVEDILMAFLTPPLEFVMGDETSCMVRAQFMGRCRTEPEPIQSIARNEFCGNVDPFLDALQRALPEQSRSQLYWKLDLVIAALVRVQTEAGKPHGFLKSSRPEDIRITIAQLVTFMAAGMKVQT
jgi:AcrR family transcriptional regulator